MAAVGFMFGLCVGNNSCSLSQSFTHFSYGIVIAFVLIPIHEYIHVQAYKWQGAKQTAYDVNWKKFYFMATADQFVASRKEFQIVALAPFVVITALLLFLLFFGESNMAAHHTWHFIHSHGMLFR